MAMFNQFIRQQKQTPPVIQVGSPGAGTGATPEEIKTLVRSLAQDSTVRSSKSPSAVIQKAVADKFFGGNVDNARGGIMQVANAIRSGQSQDAGGIASQAQGNQRTPIVESGNPGKEETDEATKAKYAQILAMLNRKRTADTTDTTKVTTPLPGSRDTDDTPLSTYGGGMDPAAVAANAMNSGNVLDQMNSGLDPNNPEDQSQFSNLERSEASLPSPEELLALERDALSQDQGGRRSLFNRYMSSSPFFRSITPIARGIVENQFFPSSAQYMLDQLREPGGDAMNYRDYLSHRGPMGFGGTDIRGLLESLQGGGRLPTSGETLAEFEDRAGAGDPSIAAIAGLLNDDTAMGNLMRQANRQQINPALRGYGDRAFTRKVDQFRDQNVETPLFMEFMRRGFSF